MDLGALTWSGWLLAALASVCVGMAKTGFGGLGMVAVVLMASVVPARDSTGVILTLLITADVYAVIAFRRHVVWPTLVRLLPSAAAGIVFGFLVMQRLPADGFSAVIGWLVLGMLGMVLFLRAYPAVSAAVAGRTAFVVSAGWLGGVSTMLANAAGPVMTVYLLACRLPKMEFVGTAAWFFFIVNVSKVPFSASMGLVNAGSLAFTAILAPLILCGAVAGRRLLGLINQRLFEALLVAFTLAGAIRLVLA